MVGTAAGKAVIVVGGGISGVACARRLHDAGHRVVVLERSHRLGGRMAVRTEHLTSGSHPVDVGAPYFTVRENDFGEVVESWRRRGLARPWTDTFILCSPDGRIGSTTSPDRWSSPYGQRILVDDLARGLDVRLRVEVGAVTLGTDGVPHVGDAPPDLGDAAAVVLAMPDPQAARLLPAELATELGVAEQGWTPVLAAWGAWRERWWPAFDGAFVDGSPSLAWVSDDGRSRGDSAPVLVVHSTADFAAAHLDDVEAAGRQMLAALPGVLGAGPMPEPEWTRVHRWSLASARHPHAKPFALAATGAGLAVGVCGDAWGPRSRVEQAWMSGNSLGAALVEHLAR
ncbi:NAD(P)/FAD-dependent oxidoreductase [Spongisporangium articulatum]|uniref:NAD(P)/FAD-dependent oxidoreductase n=1 Tax=Spongisporangium articulatum TaxID=3362603 RepID=A0ABW8AHF0_9ACTN